MVSDLVVSAPVLQFTHAGGRIGMWNYDTSSASDNDGNGLLDDADPDPLTPAASGSWAILNGDPAGATMNATGKISGSGDGLRRRSRPGDPSLHALALYPAG